MKTIKLPIKLNEEDEEFLEVLSRIDSEKDKNIIVGYLITKRQYYQKKLRHLLKHN